MELIWDNIQKIAERNALFLEEVPEAFLNKDVKMTEEELILLLLLLLDDFETEDGKLKRNRKNFFLVNKVDLIFKTFAVAGGMRLMGKLVSKFQTILANNTRYYYRVLGKSDKFTRVNNSIVELVNRRLGLNTDGSIKTGGYMYDLSNMITVRNDVREMLYRNVLSESEISHVRKALNGIIVGEKDTKSLVYKFYSKFAYDAFSQIDRMASFEFSNEYGLTTFIYYGTIINTSRSFCRKKINGIYTVAEGMKWPYESPAPVGISTATYHPVIDMGGANCRHVALFITREIEEDLLSRGYTSAPSNL